MPLRNSCIARALLAGLAVNTNTFSLPNFLFRAIAFSKNGPFSPLTTLLNSLKSNLAPLASIASPFLANSAASNLPRLFTELLSNTTIFKISFPLFKLVSENLAALIPLFFSALANLAKSAFEKDSFLNLGSISSYKLSSSTLYPFVFGCIPNSFITSNTASSFTILFSFNTKSVTSPRLPLAYSSACVFSSEK